MKRIFEVNGEYFDNKTAAKTARDNWNNTGGKQCKVSKGPDHIGNHGQSCPAARKRGPRGADGGRNTPPDTAKRAAIAAKAR